MYPLMGQESGNENYIPKNIHYFTNIFFIANKDTR